MDIERLERLTEIAHTALQDEQALPRFVRFIRVAESDLATAEEDLAALPVDSTEVVSARDRRDLAQIRLDTVKNLWEEMTEEPWGKGLK